MGENCRRRATTLALAACSSTGPSRALAFAARRALYMPPTATREQRELLLATELKDGANAAFKAGDFAKAALLYRNALGGFTPSSRAASELAVTLHSNRSESLLRAGEAVEGGDDLYATGKPLFEEALEEAHAALTLDPRHEKTRRRRQRVLVLLGEKKPAAAAQGGAAAAEGGGEGEAAAPMHEGSQDGGQEELEAGEGDEGGDGGGGMPAMVDEDDEFDSADEGGDGGDDDDVSDDGSGSGSEGEEEEEEEPAFAPVTDGGASGGLFMQVNISLHFGTPSSPPPHPPPPLPPPPPATALLILQCSWAASTTAAAASWRRRPRARYIRILLGSLL